MSEQQIDDLNILSPDDVFLLKKQCVKINAILKAYFERRKIALVSIELEFAKHKGQFVLADEISLATCELWNISADTKLDEEFFSSVPDKIEQTYLNLYHRIFGEEVS